MKRGAIIQYYVEGEDEKKLVEVLKTNGLILPGKVQVFNPVCERVSKARLITLKQGTNIVLIFDTDVDQEEILKENIKLFKACSSISSVYTIPQNRNLEDELVRACSIKDAREIFGSKSISDFKTSFIREKNLLKKLTDKQFDFNKFWVMKTTGKFRGISNDSGEIKI
ncbi:hypothetical protein SAMN04487884_1521 [Butyrivibrio fibrisolvens]|uniref:Uncharacterized protein n=1 Tax=Butyrivibrio fibrisolvens TaxID=831 RepID=A0A1H9XAJ6_BUTFI|nr:hypothetical protein [Butyrivibrio fibrisolvens]SES43134.1 hypothetical protein SAMN04487884_1521 [Butyrivibrio fibrisolvens]